MPTCSRTVTLTAIVLMAWGAMLSGRAELVDQWRPWERYVDAGGDLRATAGGRSAVFQGTASYDDEGLIVFDSGGAEALVVEDGDRNLPEAGFTVEAWVRIDRGERWGTIYGYQQDNGSYERGWYLGYEGQQFVMRASDGSTLRMAGSSTTLTLGGWHHVAGVLDPEKGELRVYVDGQKSGTATFAANGAVYPDIDTSLVIGCYLDKDERYPMRGRVREIRLYDHVLEDEAIAAHLEWAERLPDRALEFSVRPGVRFLSPTSAEVRWETSVPGGAAIAFGPDRKLGTVARSESEGTSHRAVLTGLEPGRDYFYRFGHSVGGERIFSGFYTLEGGMNYAAPPLALVVDGGAPALDELVAALPQPGGMGVVLGDASGGWAEALAKRTELTVINVVADAEAADALRRRWYERGDYGLRLSVQGAELPLPPHFANVVIDGFIPMEGIDPRAVLAPGGTLAKLQPGGGITIVPTDDAAIPPTEWGHQYGPPAGTSYSGERLAGIDRTDQLELRWLGRPGADFGIDRNPRMPAPLVAGGRLYHQGMNRMIALDAFNGSVLWSLEIPDFRRVNIPRDCGNWCADTERVYAVVKDRLWVIDGGTGRMGDALRLPEGYREGWDWGFVATEGDLLVGSAVKEGGAYEAFWGGAAWYDKQGADAVSKVCSRSVFAHDKNTGEVLWEKTADAIVNSTVALAGGKVFMVVATGEALAGDRSAKVTNADLWGSAQIVCLDARTGDRLWSAPVPESMPKDPVVAFGMVSGGKYLLEISGGGQFHFAAYEVEGGEEAWVQAVAWPEDHHGGHMQHATIVDGQVLVQPHIIALADGEVLKSGTLGKRRGCATPVGFGQGIFFRGGGGALSIWSLEDEARTGFDRIRPSCWLSVIPAHGMLFVPEGGGGCSCGGWMETSMAFAPVPTGTGANTEDTGLGVREIEDGEEGDDR